MSGCSRLSPYKPLLMAIRCGRLPILTSVFPDDKRAASLVEPPGLTARVHSVPNGPGHAGCDVHYMSVCSSCIVSRIALADVSGHGQAVAVFGEKLRELMQREELGNVHYATMVEVGRHGRRGQAVMTNAGDPPPLWYRASPNDGAGLKYNARASEGDRLVCASARSPT